MVETKVRYQGDGYTILLHISALNVVRMLTAMHLHASCKNKRLRSLFTGRVSVWSDESIVPSPALLTQSTAQTKGVPCLTFEIVQNTSLILPLLARPLF